jgi:hypothetical protein
MFAFQKAAHPTPMIPTSKALRRAAWTVLAVQSARKMVLVFLFMPQQKPLAKTMETNAPKTFVTTPETALIHQ